MGDGDKGFSLVIGNESGDPVQPLGDFSSISIPSSGSDLVGGGGIFATPCFGSTLGSIVNESISSTSPSTYLIKGKKASTMESISP